MIRKSSYGRTNFFEEGTHFKQCNSTVVPVSTSSVFHTLPPLEEESELRRRQILCWHCCHPIFPPTNGAKRKRKGGDPKEGEEESTTRVYRAPRMYDPQNSTFHVYGYFCSPSCIKTYVLDHTSFDRGEHMYAFVKMMREVYGVEEEVKEAPPREMLLSFGGPLPLSEFRTMTNECEIVKPPFVSYRMIVEERTPSLSLQVAPKPAEGSSATTLSQKGEGDVVVVQGEGEGDKKVLYTRGVKGMRRKRQDESDFLPPSPRQEGEYDPEAGFTQTASATTLPKKKKESSTSLPVVVVEKQPDAAAHGGEEKKQNAGGLARFQKKK